MSKVILMLIAGLFTTVLSAEEEAVISLATEIDMQNDALCVYQIPQSKKTPQVRNDAAACRNFRSQIDFLYWQANEDGLEYGTKMQATPIIGAASTTSTKLLDLDYKWSPGFSLDFGYTFDEFDWWALNLNWTHIHNHAHGSSSALGVESQIGIVDTIISPWVTLLFELTAGASKASAYWHVKYDTLDLDFGKSVRLSERFVISPFFGLRGGWIHQDYIANYDAVFLTGEGAEPVHRGVAFKGKNNFNGIGFRTGTELLCQLPCNWHIFSQLSANILYGKFNVQMSNLNDQGLGEGDVAPMPLNFYASEDFWRTRLSFGESIGFGWDSYFKEERYRLRLRAAYEFSQWLSQNELFHTFYFRGTDTVGSVPIRNQGDLSFQGLRLGAEFDY